MKKVIFAIAMTVVMVSCTNNSTEVKTDVDTTAVVDTTKVDSTVVTAPAETTLVVPTSGVTK